MPPGPQGGQSYGAPKYPQQSYGQAGYGLYDDAGASAAGAAGYGAGGKGDKNEALYGGQVRPPAAAAQGMLGLAAGLLATRTSRAGLHSVGHASCRRGCCTALHGMAGVHGQQQTWARSLDAPLRLCCHAVSHPAGPWALLRTRSHVRPRSPCLFLQAAGQQAYNAGGYGQQAYGGQVRGGTWAL